MSRAVRAACADRVQQRLAGRRLRGIGTRVASRGSCLGRPAVAAVTATEISGLEVANAARVAAVTAFGTRAQSEMPTTPRRNSSPPANAQTIPSNSSRAGARAGLRGGGAVNGGG